MQYAFPDHEAIRAVPWSMPYLRGKILFIRLHALGDIVIAIPSIQHLKELNPGIKMHLLVSDRCAELPRNMTVFDKVHSLRISGSKWERGFDALKICPKLWLECFDAVVDLQKNVYSRMVRRLLFPKAWCEFDRFSKIHAAHRYQNTINAIGLGKTETGKKPVLRDETSGLEKLRQAGWNDQDKLIVLNPCGLYPTRQWGVEKYLAFARIWLEKMDGSSKFLLLGTSTLQENASFLEKNLGKNCLNLIEKTTLTEVFNIVRQSTLTLSDDGGLLHISWTNQIPTIGFLGASPSYWGVPLGEKSFGFTSDDLPCGNCHRTVCQWGDNRCLSRVTPEMAFEKAKELVG